MDGGPKVCMVHTTMRMNNIALQLKSVLKYLKVQAVLGVDAIQTQFQKAEMTPQNSPGNLSKGT
eukprot:5042173-Amphidinium_carterae.1